MKNIFLLFVLSIALFSCEQSSLLKQEEQVFENPSTEIESRGWGKGKSLIINEILLYTDTMLVTFDEFYTIQTELIDNGFAVAKNCSFITTHQAPSQAQWTNRVSDSFQILHWDDVNEEVKFYIDDLLLLTWDCPSSGPIPPSPICAYLNQSLNLFYGPSVYGCIAAQFIFQGNAAQYVKINLSPLLLPANQQCAPICSGN